MLIMKLWSEVVITTDSYPLRATNLSNSSLKSPAFRFLNENYKARVHCNCYTRTTQRGLNYDYSSCDLNGLIDPPCEKYPDLLFQLPCFQVSQWNFQGMILIQLFYPRHTERITLWLRHALQNTTDPFDYSCALYTPLQLPYTGSLAFLKSCYNLLSSVGPVLLPYHLPCPFRSRVNSRSVTTSRRVPWLPPHAPLSV